MFNLVTCSSPTSHHRTRWIVLCVCEREWFFIYLFIFIFLYFFLQTEGRHVSAKAHKAINHLQCLCQVERRFDCRESNRQPLPWDSGISHHHPIVWGHLGPMRGRSHRSVPTSSVSIPDVKVRNVVGHHLFLKIIPAISWLGPNGKFVWWGHERECWGQGHSPCILICICTFTSAMHMWMHGSAPLNLTFLKCGWRKFQGCKLLAFPRFMQGTYYQLKTNNFNFFRNNWLRFNRIVANDPVWVESLIWDWVRLIMVHSKNKWYLHNSVTW